jgi:hypothetical protein
VVSESRVCSLDEIRLPVPSFAVGLALRSAFVGRLPFLGLGAGSSDDCLVVSRDPTELELLRGSLLPRRGDAGSTSTASFKLLNDLDFVGFRVELSDLLDLLRDLAGEVGAPPAAASASAM